MKEIIGLLKESSGGSWSQVEWLIMRKYLVDFNEINWWDIIIKINRFDYKGKI